MRKFENNDSRHLTFVSNPTVQAAGRRRVLKQLGIPMATAIDTVPADGRYFLSLSRRKLLRL